MPRASTSARYSASLVTQGRHRFYSLTMPSEVLAKCAFVSTREEDVEEGFQRNLDKKRAEDIAKYIDEGLGTIPSAVILSAQPKARLRDVSRGKTVEFEIHAKSFLIIDGQHRVYGFRLAKTPLRVPVVIFNGLTRSEEARLFIDINTKQRPVPSELLLDIKRLAESETDIEGLLKDVFDMFDTRSDSALAGQTSRTTRAKGKLSRVTFNPAVKQLLTIFAEGDPDRIYSALNAYLHAVRNALTSKRAEKSLTKPTVFKAFLGLFPDVARKSSDRFGRKFTVDNFSEVLKPAFENITAATLRDPGSSYKQLVATMKRTLEKGFVI